MKKQRNILAVMMIMMMLLAALPAASVMASPDTTTLGDGTSPADKFVKGSETDKAVSTFTLSADVSGITVTTLTVTGTNTGDVAASGVKLWLDGGSIANEWDAGDTQVGSGISFVGADATFSFSPTDLPVPTTTTQYLITYDITASPTNAQTMQANVSSFAVDIGTITGSDNVDATITVDTVAPTISIGAPSASITDGASVTYTVTYSDTHFNSSTLTSGNITLNKTGTANGTVGVDSGTGTSRTVTISSISGDGTLGISIGSGTASDLAGNLAPASGASSTFTVDNTAPSFLPVTPATGAFINNITTASDVSYTLSETLTSGSIVMTWSTGTADLLSPHTCTLVGTALSAGTHANFDMSNLTNGCSAAQSLVNGAVYTFAFNGTDAAGNSTTTSSNGVTFDITPPSVTISQAAGQLDPTRVSPINFAVVFSEVTTDFLTGDVTLTATTGVTTTATVTGSGTTYNVAVTGMTTSGTVTINIAAGVAHDAAGNANTVGIISDNTVTYDIVVPTVTFDLQVGSDTGSSSTDNITNAANPVFDAIFSEAITSFVNTDLTFTGTATGCTFTIGTPTLNTYPVTASGCTDGTMTIRMIAGSVTDLAGNLIAQTDGPAVTLDRVGPTVNMTTTASNPTGISPIPVSVTFSEVVADFISTDITPTNGTVAQFIPVSGTSYTFNLYPTVQGIVSADIAAGVAHDTAGNGNTAATTLSITYDSIVPLVSMSSTTTSSTNISPIPVTVTFSKSVTGFTSSDITPTHGTVSGFLGSGASYTFNLIPAGQGLVSADIAANVAQDSAGNWNAAASTFTRNYDTIAPAFSSVVPLANAYINSITLSSAVSYTLSETLGTGSISMVRTGGTADSGTHNCAFTGTALNSGAHNNFNLSDTTNGCILAQSLVSGAIYTFTFSGADAAGNSATAVIQTGVTFDNVGPAISIGAPNHAVTDAGPVTYTITYTDTSFNASSLAAGNITLNKTGTANGSLSVDVSTGSSRVVTISSITGDGTLGISIAAGTANDKAGNLAPASSASANFTVDNTPPQLTWTSPVPAEGIYNIGNPSVLLEATASDNTSVYRVAFYRWDYIKLTLIKLGDVFQAPYRFTLDATGLLPNYNEIDAYAYDTAGNQSAYHRILLYKYPMLFVSKIGVGSGTITSLPVGINCGSTCAYGFNNLTVTLSAVPSGGSNFQGWGGACSGKGTCTVNVTSDKTVTANFFNPNNPNNIFIPLIFR